ncbi:MAG TPA: MGMT family protein, partial [archaeon]|nr:MGMT family protein [archaeon]
MRSASSGRSLREATGFQQRVYALVRRIPTGRVTTYGALAKELRTSPRAVGQALAANPFSYCAYPTEAAA